MLRRTFTLLLLAPALWLSACASSPEPAPPAQRPQEFVLSATVYAPAGQGTARPERALRPGRYIVEADGVLRAALGPGATTTTYPHQTRQLTPDQLDALWRTLVASGLLTDPDATPVPNPDIYTPPEGRTTAVVYAAWRGRREAVAVSLDRHRGAITLIDHLAELAWVPR